MLVVVTQYSCRYRAVFVEVAGQVVGSGRRRRGDSLSGLSSCWLVDVGESYHGGW